MISMFCCFFVIFMWHYIVFNCILDMLSCLIWLILILDLFLLLFRYIFSSFFFRFGKVKTKLTAHQVLLLVAIYKHFTNTYWTRRNKPQESSPVNWARSKRRILWQEVEPSRLLCPGLISHRSILNHVTWPCDDFSLRTA